MKGTRKLAGLLLVALAPFVAAVTGAPPAGSDPVVAARAAELANKLRCLVCQNQSIADSNAGLAVDLRREIREQIAAGRTDDEILDFMVSRYGDFVLYRPPFRAHHPRTLERSGRPRARRPLDPRANVAYASPRRRAAADRGRAQAGRTTARRRRERPAVTAFVAVAAAMIAVAVAWVLRPLLSGRAATSPDRETASLAVLRDQLAELETDLARGILAPERYEQARQELERRVLDEVDLEAPARAAAPATVNAWTAAILGATIPIAAIVLYVILGTPSAHLAKAPGAGPRHDVDAGQLEAMVARLAAQVEGSPEDAKGWTLLARSYSVMGRYPEAVRAYERAAALVPRDADLLADFADTLAVTQGRNLQGKPLELVQRALEIDPEHWKALALAGTAAFDRKDYGRAIAYWERLERVAPAGSEIGRSVGESIAEARALAGAKRAAPGSPQVASAPAGAKVTGKVTLAEALAVNAAPTDTVFIFARAASGPPMPLAVLRKQVKDLPLDFMLDDSMAMAPDLKLSRFSEVIVVARISRSGSATPQSGDVQGFSEAVKIGATGVSVVIDTALP
jgi:cytochrome c-type biogenesis protein CcmH